MMYDPESALIFWSLTISAFTLVMAITTFVFGAMARYYSKDKK